MNVIVDTSVWSLALRRNRPPAAEADVLAKLLQSDLVALLGVIRLEILSGIPDPKRFRQLRDELRKLPDYPLSTEHYELAAENWSICRAKGVQGSHVDFLLCAVAQLDRLPILTTDKDFVRYQKYLPITLFEAT